MCVKCLREEHLPSLGVFITELRRGNKRLTYSLKRQGLWWGVAETSGSDRHGWLWLCPHWPCTLGPRVDADDNSQALPRPWDAPSAVPAQRQGEGWFLGDLWWEGGPRSWPEPRGDTDFSAAFQEAHAVHLEGWRAAHACQSLSSVHAENITKPALIYFTTWCYSALFPPSNSNEL